MRQKKLLVIVLLFITLASLFLLFLIRQDFEQAKETGTSEVIGEVEIKPDVKEEEETVDYRQMYKDYYDINNDYVGYLKFDSGLIEFPIFQSYDNNHYMRLNWHTGEYAAEGSPFLDYRNSFYDQNLIIYGHYVYSSYDPSMTKAFTPLGELREEANYKKNSTLKFYLEDEAREYQVAYVYYCLLTEESEYKATVRNMQYYWTDYSEGYFETYINAVENAQFYDTGVDLGYDDSFITLLTCVENHPELRLVVICKQVGTTPYEK